MTLTVSNISRSTEDLRHHIHWPQMFGRWGVRSLPLNQVEAGLQPRESLGSPEQRYGVEGLPQDHPDLPGDPRTSLPGRTI